MAIVRIPLSSRKYPGLFALVDEEDVPLVSGHTWTLSKKANGFYARRDTSRKTGRQIVYMHREVCKTNAPKVDHVNGDTLNNTRANLRPSSHTGNQCNRRMQSNNTLGFRGISWHPRGAKKWRARVRYKGEWHEAGTYDTPEEAARAYDAVAKAHHGEFARLNFPTE